MDARDLRNVGGAEGVGVAFLEETFAAPPRRRIIASISEPPARCSNFFFPIRAPTSRGRCVPRAELLEASGYDNPRLRAILHASAIGPLGRRSLSTAQAAR